MNTNKKSLYKLHTRSHLQHKQSFRPNYRANMVEEIDCRLGRGVHFAHLNCQSAYNKIDSIKLHLDICKFDVLTLSETWFHELHSDQLLEIDGYRLVRQDRKTLTNTQIQKRGGGVAIYTKKILNSERKPLQEASRSDANIELVWTLIKNEKQSNIAVGSLYRPPNGDIEDFIAQLETSLESVSKLAKTEIFLLGDFNINYKTNNKSKHLLDNLIKSRGLKQKISELTRLGENSSIIDLIITDSNHAHTSGTRNWGISDHELIYVTRKKIKTKNKTTPRMGRSYQNYTKEALENHLEKNIKLPFPADLGVNDQWNNVVGEIRKHLDTTCPIKKLKIKNNQDPWVTPRLINLIMDKYKTGKLAKSSGRLLDIENYHKARNRSQKTVRKAKRQYIVKQDQQWGNNSHKFWNNVKILIPNNKNKDLITLYNNEGMEISSSDAANVMNKHFSTIGNKLSNKFNSNWTTKAPQLNAGIGDCRTTIKEISDLIKSIDCNKPSGIKNISSVVLKDALGRIPDAICDLFNKSFREGTYVDCWKIARVTPLHKGGDKQVLGNYRPISILPLPGKLMEKIMHRHIMDHLNEHKILNSKQGGFRKKHSTIKTIANLITDITNSINNKNLMGAAFIDFSKAFDTVDHRILKSKLTRMGITGVTEKWLTSYLENRKQCTMVNGSLSSEEKIGCGVPQGSVLGPLLFLIYINDLNNWLETEDIQLYADDTVVYAAGKTTEEIEMQLNLTLKKLSEWCQLNRVTINNSKSKTVLFGTRLTSKDKIKCLLGDTELEQIDNYRYLGVDLDRHLNYDLCITNTIKKVNHKIWLLAKLRYYMTESMAIKIYKGMILPYFDYGDVIYMGGNTKLLNKLQVLQNRALKVCLQVHKRYPTIELHRKCKTTLLANRREMHLKILAYHYTTKRGYTVIPRRDTRHMAAPVLLTAISNTKIYERSVLAMAAHAWNNQSPQQRAIGSLDHYKKFLKKIK